MVHFSTCFIYEKHHHTCKGTHFFQKNTDIHIFFINMVSFVLYCLKKHNKHFFLWKKNVTFAYIKLKVFPTFDTYYSLTR